MVGVDNLELREREKNFISFNFISDKLRIKVIGGGKGANIKVKTFCKNGCKVEILAQEFNEEVLELENLGVKYFQGEYDKDFIVNGHIVLIAIDNEEVCKHIVKDCEDLSKIYIDCTNFKRGMGVVPSQRQLNNLNFSLSTKVGVPKLSKILSDKVNDLLSEYDEFVYFVAKVRENAKNETNKSEIINFICSDDFKYFYEKRKAKEVLQMYYGKDVAQRLLENNIL